MDDFSRIMRVYILKTKDKALNAFKKFKAVVENKSKKRIQVFITDSGGEFFSREFLSYCKAIRIRDITRLSTHHNKMALWSVGSEP